ncbi:hypothetical protein [Roseomonas mucosa]
MRRAVGPLQADTAPLNSRVVDVATLIELSRATLANIHQSVAIALSLKAVSLMTLNALRLLGYHFKGVAHG